MEVEDNLYSYSTENALSANQGRVLREEEERIDGLIQETNTSVATLEEKVANLEKNPGGGSTSNGCMTKIWDETN